MPLYEYQCDVCGRRFELIRKFSDPPLEACPTCGGAVRKLMSSPAFQFKGSGWYITDYARKDQASPVSEDSKSEAGQKETGAKTDNKSADTAAEKTKRTEKGEKTEKAKPSEKSAKSDAPASTAAPGTGDTKG
jgi:putative FmdB family regulatory protein